MTNKVFLEEVVEYLMKKGRKIELRPQGIDRIEIKIFQDKFGHPNDSLVKYNIHPSDLAVQLLVLEGMLKDNANS